MRSLLLAVLLASSCTAATSDLDGGVCLKDTDCKGDRICMGGSCVEPAGADMGEDDGRFKLLPPDMSELPDLVGRVDSSMQPDIATPSDLSQTPDLWACKVDGDCSGPTPRCDAPSGRCVPCLPLNDNCAMGTYCATDLDAGVGGYTCNKGCKPPLVSCGGACVDTTSDLNNCGACNNACIGAFANWSCTNSACAVKGCNSTYRDCNMDPKDGCEVNIISDVNNCLGCGKVCDIPHASAMCDTGCVLVACNPGYADCNMVAADGCEVNILGHDNNNCGACGVVCGGNTVCVVGLCK